MPLTSALTARRRLLGKALGLSVVAATANLAGCGWHLRGEANIPFKTIHIAFAPSSTLGNELKRSLRTSSKIKVVDTPQEAEAILTPSGEARSKIVLSVDAAARAREYRLQLVVAIRVHDLKGNEFLPGESIILTRDVSFNEGQVLAKEYEDALLYRDMQTDMVQQILRRLGAIDRSRVVN